MHRRRKRKLTAERDVVDATRGVDLVGMDDPHGDARAAHLTLDGLQVHARHQSTGILVVLDLLVGPPPLTTLDQLDVLAPGGIGGKRRDAEALLVLALTPFVREITPRRGARPA